VDSSDESEQFPIDTFITQVSRISQISFDNTATLIEGLKLHIIPAINRLKANIETYNPLTDMIKKDYPLLFASVKKALYMVWPKLQFPDSEIGFIVLHFGGAINKKATTDFHVLVVCSSGIGTSQILAARLQ
ncbi:PTS lactose transporter subunit IIB, partial [Staphylococcus cohnii]